MSVESPAESICGGNSADPDRGRYGPGTPVADMSVHSEGQQDLQEKRMGSENGEHRPHDVVARNGRCGAAIYCLVAVEPDAVQLPKTQEGGHGKHRGDGQRHTQLPAKRQVPSLRLVGHRPYAPPPLSSAVPCGRQDRRQEGRGALPRHAWAASAAGSATPVPSSARLLASTDADPSGRPGSRAAMSRAHEKL